MSSYEYVKAAVAEVVEDLDKEGLKLKGKAHQLYDSNYKPELDVTEELDDKGVAKFQGYIGMFHWMIQLGCISIMTEVSQLSSFQAMPRRGHLDACYSIFAFLRKHPAMSMVFHPSWIKIQQDHFKSEKWTDFYGDVEEELLADMPKPLGEPVRMTVYADSDHAGNLIMRQSQTGYII